jgi:2-dehydro-3-deoxyphosphogluconate aldolase / (4S)-4-hydroxy-2-oxoglutarate aldolase
LSIICVAIARGLNEDQMLRAFEAAVKGGIKHLEITMNTDNAPELINRAYKEFNKSAEIGAGTVITIKDLHRALNSDARFIVSPVTNTEMIKYCKKMSIPVFPGALTPTEVYTAWEAGATMVKVFPVNAAGGPEYIKSLKGPLDSVKLLACNGVSPGNIEEYIEKGADGVALAGQLFNKEWISAGDYRKVKAAAELFSKYCM